jgi:hypothetical protein
VTPRYASNTEVSTDRSRDEIERVLTKYGARSFMYGWDEQQAMIGFVLHDRQIRFLLPMPARDAREFTHTPERGTKRSEAQAYAAWEQARRQRWRALALVVKAKLEAVSSGIIDFESEFLAHIVTPNGLTVGEQVLPRMRESIESGSMPDLLPALEARHGS